MLFLCYPKCSTCQKAKKYLDDNHISYQLRDIKLNNPSYDELAIWYRLSNKPLKSFFNTSGLLYKELGLAKKLPTMNEDEMLKLLSSNGMLVKRPIIVNENQIIIGFKEENYKILHK